MAEVLHIHGLKEARDRAALQQGPPSIAPVDLRIIAAELATVDRLTEVSFLEIGRQVEEFHGRAIALSSRTADALQLLEGKTGAETLIRLQLLVERCSLWLAQAKTQNSKITGILEMIDLQLARMATPLNGLLKVVKTLQALKVSTRIEGAKNHGSGAAGLARELQRLTRMIQDKVLQIQGQADMLNDLNVSTLSIEKNVGSGLLRSADQDIQATRRELSRIDLQRLETTGRTAILKQRSEEIAHAFGEMVAALQFQDITRQRFSHIQKALQEISAQLVVPGPEEELLPNNDAQLLARSVCRLQGEQLKLAMEEFVNAADQLVCHLREMVTSVRSMAGEVDNCNALKVAEAAEDSNPVALLLQSVTGRLEAALRSNGAASNAILSVDRVVNEISRQGEEIEFIGEEMQLLAFNAAINAAHSRGRGAGLEVIAQHIQNLSEEAFAQTVALAGECRSVTEQAEGLEQLDTFGTQQEQMLKPLLDEGRSLTKALQQNRAELGAQIREVAREAERFGTDVAICLCGIDIQGRFQSRVAPLLRQLSSLSQETARHLKGHDGRGLMPLFKNLQSQYTMQSEREVHHRVVDGHAAHAPQRPAEDDAAGGWRGGDDLGDNVELF
jgi:methyl-accepting chemotaxis protein